MSVLASHRLVPIRPSPAKGILSSSKALTININTTSPSTLTPPRTGVKRKLEPESPESVKCKRRINFGVNYVVSPQPPAAVERRNARERNRVKQVNNGFATLRQHIPGAAKAKKISKVDTLKQAVDYIRDLQDLLDEHDMLMRQNAPVATPQPAPISNTFNFNTIPATAIATVPQTRVSYSTFYYNENVSPCSVFTIPSSVAHSPTCSDITTSSPSPSYLSDTSSQISSHDPLNTGVVTKEEFGNSYGFSDAYSGTFDIYGSVPTLEEDEVLDVIASWQERQ